MDGSETERPYVDKYNYMQKNENAYVVLCRTALVYLRYAEAVNRLGNPNSLYGVLKYGLSKNTFEIYNDLLKDELMGEPWIDFGLTSSGDIGMFDVNSGCMAVGAARKNLELDPTFVIEACASSADTSVAGGRQAADGVCFGNLIGGQPFPRLDAWPVTGTIRLGWQIRWLPSFPKESARPSGPKLLNRQNWYLPTTVEFGEK